jgi:hypothetical protein
MSKALSSAILSHSDSHLSDLSAFTEELLDVPLLSLEAKVANKDGVSLSCNSASGRATEVSLGSTTEVSLRSTTSWGAT